MKLLFKVLESTRHERTHQPSDSRSPHVEVFSTVKLRPVQAIELENGRIFYKTINADDLEFQLDGEAEWVIGSNYVLTLEGAAMPSPEPAPEAAPPAPRRGRPKGSGKKAKK